ncbi:MAG: acyltransferase, partial [Pseudomonadota bacterium]
MAGSERITAVSTHVVDQMLAQRAPGLLASRLWPLLGPLRDLLFGYRKAHALADALGPLGGTEALDYVSELLSLVVRTHGVERVPAQGPCVLVANHPTGIADGVALYDAIKAH